MQSILQWVNCDVTLATFWRYTDGENYTLRAVQLWTIPATLHTALSRPTQPFNPPGLANDYQLRLGRQRQVWFIPLADWWTRGVQVKLWDPLRTRAIHKRFRGVFTTRRYICLPLPLHVYCFGENFFYINKPHID